MGTPIVLFSTAEFTLKFQRALPYHIKTRDVSVQHLNPAICSPESLTQHHKINNLEE
jgi:hypothetical protein